MKEVPEPGAGESGGPVEGGAEPRGPELPGPPGGPPPRTDPPWGFGDLALLLVFCVTALVLAQSLGSSIYSLLGGRLGWPIGAQEKLRDARFILPVQLVAYSFIVAFIYLLVTRKYQRRFWDAIHWKHAGKTASTSFMAGIALAFGSELVPLLFPSEKQLPIEKIFNSPAAGYLLALFGILVAPFVEELLFRGMVYPVFERHWGLGIAVLATAGLFAAIHGPQLGGSWPQVGAIFLVGLALTYARGSTGSLVPAFLMHVSYNSTLFTSLFVATHGFQTWPPG